MALYTSSCCLWKKNRNVYITCMHTTHNASERVQKSQFDVWQLKWHNRERERKRIHEYKSKNATTTNNYAKGIWLA